MCENTNSIYKDLYKHLIKGDNSPSSQNVEDMKIHEYLN